jgi:hypothetical protein
LILLVQYSAIHRWAIRKKSVDWSNTDTLLLGEIIGKAIVSLQFPEVLSDEAIQVLLCKKIWISKAIVSFQTPEFSKVKRYKYSYAKKIELAKRLYNFKPRIFKGEAIHVLLRQKNWIGKAIVSFQTQNF